MFDDAHQKAATADILFSPDSLRTVSNSMSVIQFWDSGKFIEFAGMLESVRTRGGGKCRHGVSESRIQGVHV